ncbi:calcium-binding protein [Aphanothece sacrum]|uniref:Hemolysin-type calcium-binding repeat protein n=1 Tax=Aphanothece sacrum FPU1 TaxID=1920663 RepID=A0A401IH20_APHSA|nr:calcium-binding protein [Aphanothece sacrum]GBF80582.1 hemolysin-type calcium-binding repeat protein [Aphanothece sacrum FPU1]GBF84028.1 hemolysin-type calcium-binding protein [Aphanothece sacrum FPU3]
MLIDFDSSADGIAFDSRTWWWWPTNPPAIHGTHGNDHLYGDQYSPWYYTYNDTIYGYSGDDYISSGLGNDTVYGGSGNDTINGGSGNDLIYGEDGNDLIYGGEGNDVINGGNGYDTVNYSHLHQKIILKPQGVVEKGNHTSVDQLNSIETIIANPLVSGNTIDSSTATGTTFISVNLEAASLNVNGLPFGTLTFHVFNFDDVKGTQNSDFIVGDSQANNLYGNGGNDIISGRSGNDYIDGGSGNDFLFGENDNDYLVGSYGNDYLDGGMGNDTLTGVGSHSLGYYEIDTLIGGSGSDLFLLGDYHNPYYVGGYSHDYAFIGDFQTGVDKLQLHGYAHDYSFQGSQIHYQSDLVAIVGGTSFNLHDINFAGRYHWWPIDDIVSYPDSKLKLNTIGEFQSLNTEVMV